MARRGWIRVGLLSLALGLAGLTTPTTARAEPDTFGTGDGHRGAFVGAVGEQVINAYAPLTADAANGAMQVTIGAPFGDPAGFAVEDLVMILRATGIAANEAPSGVQTKLQLAVASGGAVGRYEFARVKTVNATTLTFAKPLTQAFAKDLTQVIKIPEHTTVDIPLGSSIVALPWQPAGTGFVGGIVAFLANGAVTVEGTVSADLRGFRGGAAAARVANLAVNCQNDDGTLEAGYAPKGEGLVATEFGNDKGGRGNRSTGAGGGNCVENGGGGGGNEGAGGQGGLATLGLPGASKSGLGGASVGYSLFTRMSFGAGGGAGEQKNGLGSGGGRGGGGVFLRALSLGGAGRISANGEAAANTQLVGLESDGAGGGGAGGSIAIRLVGDATCGGLDASGGKGGDSAQAGLLIFGPGGGGGGGRVLLQAKAVVACPIVTAGAANGNANGVAQAANPGLPGSVENIPAPGGGYCFSNAAVSPQCANPSPVCDGATGFCFACSGPFGGGTAHACAVAVQPVCAATGACSACTGDFGGGSASACQVGTSPFCSTAGVTAGSCGKCSTNADCAGAGHVGPTCNPTTGACVVPCTSDATCKATEWCSQSICVPKTPNGEHVPNGPPIDGECTPEKGTRVCTSGVCEPADDLCGLAGGSGCTGLEQCRSKLCLNGKCSDCTTDQDCKPGSVCASDKGQCVPGCREVGGASNCTAPKRCSKSDGTVGQCLEFSVDGGIIDHEQNEGFVDGVIQGGGCACRTSLPIAGSPLAIAGAAVAVLIARRRRARRTEQG